METEFDIFTGFGPVGSTENFGLDRKVLLLLRAFFYVFMGKKNTYCSDCTKKLHNIKVRKP